MWKIFLKKHKKKILIISLILLVYTLVMINIIPVKRGEISFSANSISECYNEVSSHFEKEKSCWIKNPYKNFIWNIERSWQDTGCQPCHIQNTIFQNCVENLEENYNIKTRIGLSKKTFHTWSVVNGQEIDVYYGIYR